MPTAKAPHPPNRTRAGAVVLRRGKAWMAEFEISEASPSGEFADGPSRWPGAFVRMVKRNGNEDGGLGVFIFGMSNSATDAAQSVSTFPRFAQLRKLPKLLLEEALARTWEPKAVRKSLKRDVNFLQSNKRNRGRLRRSCFANSAATEVEGVLCGVPKNIQPSPFAHVTVE